MALITGNDNRGKMKNYKKYTIFTEDITRNIPLRNGSENVSPVSIALKYFSGCFVSYGTGYYGSLTEKSVKIEIDTDRENDIYLLINDIKWNLLQKEVLLEITEPIIKFI